MRASVVLALDRRGALIPLGRTRRPDLLRAVAAAVLDDIEQARAAETDEVVSALLAQECERLQRAFRLLGLGVAQ